MISILSENVKSFQHKYKTIKSPQSVANVKKTRKCIKCGRKWVTKYRYQFRCFVCHEYEDDHPGAMARDERWLIYV